MQGFSDSWAWYQYIFGSVCKFRVYSSNAASNIILKVNSVVGTAPVRVFIMDKNAFTYPQQSFDVVVGSTQTDFNISSNYFEYLVYVLPDTFSSGSYRIDVALERAYQPEAFQDTTEDPENNPSNGDADASKNETTTGGDGSADAGQTEGTDSTNENTNETSEGGDGSSEASTTNDSGEQANGQNGVIPPPNSTEIAQEMLDRVDSTGSSAIKPESTEAWDPSRLIKDKDSFMLLLVVAAIFCVLCCFMICIGYWLTRHSWKQNKNI